jgi:tRNA (guanine37-N1)-methyltransferase
MLLKAEPIIQAIEYCIEQYTDGQHFRVCILTPSPHIFDQKIASMWAADFVPTIFVCGRYEGFDHRIMLWGRDTYPEQRKEISIGKFVLLGGEVASMCMIESIIRLVP